MSRLKAVFKDADLRKKILFTIAMIILYRIGTQIPSPGVDYQSISGQLRQLTQDQSSVYSLINLFSGGALLQLSIFAIGIMPYITASIIVQLLTVVIPHFEELKKEGQSGQSKMMQYTRYLTVALALLQSAGIVALADREQLLGQGVQVLLPDRSIFDLAVLVLVMTSGAVLVMWLGELITERGIGNGMSLLIFAGIATQMPAQGAAILSGSGGVIFAAVCVAVFILVVGVVFIEQGQRRIPVQYAKRMVGRRQYGGTSTYLPLKVNQAGVIPVIFASSLIYVPVLVTQIILSGQSNPSGDSWWQRNVIQYLQSPASYQYITLYFVLIIAFSYFYVSVQYDPVEQADNMKRYGGFIPGIRPGRPTAQYLGFVMNRLLFVGSLYLAIIAILPNIMMDLGVGGTSSAQTPFGGTAILILVSVALTTVKQIESQVLQSNYEGFLK